MFYRTGPGSGPVLMEPFQPSLGTNTQAYYGNRKLCDKFYDTGPKTYLLHSFCMMHTSCYFDMLNKLKI